MICHDACPVNKQPSRFVTSPSSHSVRKKALSPDVDWFLWFLYICGSCANSHDIMLHVPSTVDMRARFVGTHVCSVAESLYRNSFAGSQCAGNEGAAIRRGDRYGGMICLHPRRGATRIFWTAQLPPGCEVQSMALPITRISLLLSSFVQRRDYGGCAIRCCAQQMMRYSHHRTAANPMADSTHARASA